MFQNFADSMPPTVYSPLPSPTSSLALLSVDSPNSENFSQRESVALQAMAGVGHWERGGREETASWGLSNGLVDVLQICHSASEYRLTDRL